MSGRSGAGTEGLRAGDVVAGATDVVTAGFSAGFEAVSGGEVAGGSAATGLIGVGSAAFSAAGDGAAGAGAPALPQESREKVMICARIRTAMINIYFFI